MDFLDMIGELRYNVGEYGLENGGGGEGDIGGGCRGKG